MLWPLGVRQLCMGFSLATLMAVACSAPGKSPEATGDTIDDPGDARPDPSNFVTLVTCDSETRAAHDDECWPFDVSRTLPLPCESGFNPQVVVVEQDGQDLELDCALSAGCPVLLSAWSISVADPATATIEVNPAVSSPAGELLMVVTITDVLQDNAVRRRQLLAVADAESGPRLLPPVFEGLSAVWWRDGSVFVVSSQLNVGTSSRLQSRADLIPGAIVARSWLTRLQPDGTTLWSMPLPQRADSVVPYGNSVVAVSQRTVSVGSSNITPGTAFIVDQSTATTSQCIRTESDALTEPITGAASLSSDTWLMHSATGGVSVADFSNDYVESLVPDGVLASLDVGLIQTAEHGVVATTGCVRVVPADGSAPPACSPASDGLNGNSPLIGYGGAVLIPSASGQARLANLDGVLAGDGSTVVILNGVFSSTRGSFAMQDGTWLVSSYYPDSRESARVAVIGEDGEFLWSAGLQRSGARFARAQPIDDRLLAVRFQSDAASSAQLLLLRHSHGTLANSVYPTWRYSLTRDGTPVPLERVEEAALPEQWMR